MCDGIKAASIVRERLPLICGSATGHRRCPGALLIFGLVVLPLSALAAAPEAGDATAAAAGPDAASAASTRPADELDMLATEDESLRDIELLELEVPTVVSASRREQKANAVPYAVSVITREDIRMSGARSVPDALRLVPGVDVAEIAYGVYAVAPRGMHSPISRNVLVLVDGRQIFDSAFGGTFWGAWPFQLEDIERIEVVRGPGGVAWGPNAVSGVINVITKDPADQQGLTVTGGGGSRGTNREHVGYGLTDGKLRLRLSGEHESSDGFVRGGNVLFPQDDEYRSGRAGVHGIYEANPQDTWTFSLGSGLEENGHPAGPAAGFSPNQPGAQANYGLLRWDHRVEAGNAFQLTAYVNDFGFSSPVPSIDYRYEQLAVLFSHTLTSGDHTFTWGIDNRTDLVDASNADPHLLTKDRVSTHIIGLYAQDEWRFAPRWALNLGARMDYEFYGGTQPSARIALSRELWDDHMVYGAVSRSFQMLPGAARFIQAPIIEGMAGIRADDTLSPEGMMAYELGYHGRFRERLDVNAVLFWHEYEDALVFVPRLGPPGLLNMAYDNEAATSLYGLSGDARYRATDRLTLLGHYTLQRMDWRSPYSYDTTDYIDPPRNKFMVGSRYSVTDDLHLSSHLYYVDVTRTPDAGSPFRHTGVPSYLRLDLRAEHEFWKDKASVAVGVRNLLDPSHPEGSSLFYNTAEVPRTVYMEVRMVFK